MHVVVTNPNPNTHCGCCGRALTDHVSVKLGIGPVCRNNAFVKSQPSMFSIRADYSVETFDDVVAIVDLDLGNRSVTNDAEAVVAELVAQGVITSETKFVVYRDSQGTWDEMVVRQGRFSGFLSLGYADRDTSIAKARHKRSEHANQPIGSADETWDAPFDLPA